MTKLHQQIEEMRSRLTENAQREQALLRALSEALQHVDQSFLSEVRHVTAEHEARRGLILEELQTLAARLCILPAPRETLTALGESASDLPTLHTNGHPHSPGDWRRAASNIEDDLDFYLKGPSPSH
jgi:cell division septum initiation protein DivIVA